MERGRPLVGDVARIHYSCELQKGGTGGADIENSRKFRRRPLEFVVGSGQVVKGIDRSVKTMLYGERAKLFITAVYAYGDTGYPPLIPPGAALVFDVNLLDFWPRPRWQKPLVQVLSDSYTEKPYANPRGNMRPSSGSGEKKEKASKSRRDSVDPPYGKVGRY